MRGMEAETGVVLEIAAPSMRLRIDADRLIQVVINLVGNAIKFSPAGGAVRITARRESDHAVVEVRGVRVAVRRASPRWLRLQTTRAATAAATTRTARMGRASPHARAAAAASRGRHMSVAFRTLKAAATWSCRLQSITYRYHRMRSASR